MARLKWAALTLAASMAFSVLAGCGQGAKTSDASKTTSQESTVKERPLIEIEYTHEAAGSPSTEDYIKAELDKKFNINLKRSNTASPDYQAQLNLRMNAGNPPDIFEIRSSRTDFLKFARNDMILDLTPYKDKQLANVIKFLGGDQNINRGVVNSKLYGLYRPTNIYTNTYWIRKDWLDKLGLKKPETLDDLYTAAKAFTHNDPDGNGKQDTYGFTGIGTGVFNIVFGTYGTGGPGQVVIKPDGKLQSSYYDPKMKDALAYCAKLVEEGLIDPDFMVNKGGQDLDKAFQGKIGILGMDWGGMTKDEQVAKYKAVNPNAEWIPVGALQGPAGKYDIPVLYIPANMTALCLGPQLEKDKVKLERVFEILDYLATKDGSDLVNYGIKGKHFNEEGGKVVATDLMGKEGGWFWYYQMLGRNELEYLTVKFPKQKTAYEFTNSQPRIKFVNSVIDLPENMNMNDTNTYTDDMITKFIFKKESLDKYDDFVKTLESKYNYKAFLSEAEKQSKALGIIK